MELTKGWIFNIRQHTFEDGIRIYWEPNLFNEMWFPSPDEDKLGELLIDIQDFCNTYKEEGCTVYFEDWGHKLLVTLYVKEYGDEDYDDENNDPVIESEEFFYDDYIDD